MADGVAPDVRDGLTPVGRRALRELGALRAQTSLYRKSADTVDAILRQGRVDGGRRAIYGELVRMASDWELRHPLVDGGGNLGSIDDDGAASADYTEMRLGALGDELLLDVGEDVLEGGGPGVASPHPGVLPARFPNLLVNGSFSVATGAASRIPPHNLREVIDAVIAYISDPAIDTAALMGHILGPDFPTGAIVLAGAELHDAYGTGHGSIRVRARTRIEPGPLPPRAIVVTELPFMVSKGGRGGVLAEIRRVTRNKRIRGVRAVEDESSEAAGLRIVIELARDADAEIVLEQLYEHTRLQTTFELQLVANVAGQAQPISLRDAIARYVEHRRDVVARRSGLRSEDRVLDLVRRDLLDIAAAHGDARRTEIC
ncbi:MAG TPA: DNA gyrase subunit A [Solirubrobacteraceae bacterium]|nr:DNA gyrase subunit A [Solirubrobacteraceae bacterium]